MAMPPITREDAPGRRGGGRRKDARASRQRTSDGDRHGVGIPVDADGGVVCWTPSWFPAPVGGGGGVVFDHYLIW
jgi:hypothetical protein